QREAVDRPFRRDLGRGHADVPPHRALPRPARRGGRAARGPGRCRLHRMRALLPGLPVRDLGRQDRGGSDGGRHVRDGRRGLGSSRKIMSDPVLLVGCGKMGGAMLRGWLARGLERAVVIEPQPAQLGDLAKDPRLAIFADAASLPEALQPTALVLAIKPQSMDTALGSYRALAGATVTLSIAAGKTLSYLGRHLGAVPIVRAMPNLPAS